MYPKIVHLSKKNSDMIKENEVEIIEGFDGATFIIKIGANGKTECFTKKNPVVGKSMEEMFKYGLKYTKRRAKSLSKLKNYTLICTYLRDKKHNVIEYDRVPKHNLVLMYAKNSKGEWLDNEQIGKIADRIGLEYPPLLYKGTVQDIERLLENMKFVSMLGGTIIDHIIMSNFESTYIRKNVEFPLLFKYVNFKKNKDKVKREDSIKTKVSKALEDIVELYCEDKEDLWKEVIATADGEGWLANDASDISSLILVLSQQFEEENAEDIKECLWDLYKKSFIHEVMEGFADFYKKDYVKEDEVERRTRRFGFGIPHC